MRDTVELLEAIGRDATLRRASAEALTQALEANDASAGLRELVASGDNTGLTEELGLKHMHVEHQTQTGGHDGDGHDDHPHHHPDRHPDHDDGKDGGKDDEPKQAPDDRDGSSPA